MAETEDQVGAVTGLAWTEVGGELLTIEGVMMPGKGRMTVTGNLKDVMKESISAAASYVRSRCARLRHQAAALRQARHPRPRAGGRHAEGRSVRRHRHGHRHHLGDDGHPDPQAHIAMTGEVTLRGRVLPIGGLKEKLLAALRGGLKMVLIPEENAKDLAEIPDNVKNGLEIIPVSRMDEVVKHALIRQPEPVEWDEEAEPVTPRKAGDEDPSGVVAH
jgi:ATP-dependent Lon protease